MDIDDCAFSPCLNNGACRDLVNDYMCDCVEGFIARNCSTNRDECSPNTYHSYTIVN